MKKEKPPGEIDRKKGKPAWEKPVLLPLGEMARGYGAPCNPVGSIAGPAANCRVGDTAPKCKQGGGQV